MGALPVWYSSPVILQFHQWLCSEQYSKQAAHGDASLHSSMQTIHMCWHTCRDHHNLLEQGSSNLSRCNGRRLDRYLSCTLKSVSPPRLCDAQCQE